MKTIIKWFLLLNKRLYKKITFVVIMALIPMVVLGLNMVAKQESGVITVALAQTDNNDAISNKAVSELISSSDLILFKVYDTPKEAIDSVKHGQCNSAWIFLDNMSERIEQFAEDPDVDNAVVNVVVREQNVALRLAHEKLSGVLYKHIAPNKYISYIRTNLSQLENLSDSQLMQYYDSYFVDAQLFEFAYPDSDNVETKEVGYLVAPVRGVLSILIVLSVMASAMFFVQDEKNGTFGWASETKKIAIEFLCQIIAALNISIAVSIALMVSGISTKITRELIIVVLYSVACALFGMLLRNIFNSNKLLGALMPLMIVVMTAICPVFFEFKKFRFLQRMFPPTYYINAINNNRFINYMLIYIAVCTVLLAGVIVIRQNKTKFDFIKNIKKGKASI